MSMITAGAAGAVTIGELTVNRIGYGATRLTGRGIWGGRATTGRVALAWPLPRSPMMLPIPGTSSVAHLKETVAPPPIRVDRDGLEALSTADWRTAA